MRKLIVLGLLIGTTACGGEEAPKEEVKKPEPSTESNPEEAPANAEAVESTANQKVISQCEADMNNDGMVEKAILTRAANNNAVIEVVTDNGKVVVYNASAELELETTVLVCYSEGLSWGMREGTAFAHYLWDGKTYVYEEAEWL